MRARSSQSRARNRGLLATNTNMRYLFPMPWQWRICGRVALLKKTRFRSVHAGRTWEIDVYSDENIGLVIAEIEMESEDAAVDLPRWVGREVTGEERYYASRLAARPFSGWRQTSTGGGR